MDEAEALFDDATKPFTSKQSKEQEAAENKFLESVKMKLLCKSSSTDLNNLAQKKTVEALKAYMKFARGQKQKQLKAAVAGAAPESVRHTVKGGLFQVLSGIFPEVCCAKDVCDVLTLYDKKRRQSQHVSFGGLNHQIKEKRSQFHEFNRLIRQALHQSVTSVGTPPHEDEHPPQSDATNNWKAFQSIPNVKAVLPKLAAVLIEAIISIDTTGSRKVSFVNCLHPEIDECYKFLPAEFEKPKVTEEIWSRIQKSHMEQRWLDAYNKEAKEADKSKDADPLTDQELMIQQKKDSIIQQKTINKLLTMKAISRLNQEIGNLSKQCLRQFDYPAIYPRGSDIQALQSFNFFLQDDWFDKVGAACRVICFALCLVDSFSAQRLASGVAFGQGQKPGARMRVFHCSEVLFRRKHVF